MLIIAIDESNTKYCTNLFARTYCRIGRRPFQHGPLVVGWKTWKFSYRLVGDAAPQHTHTQHRLTPPPRQTQISANLYRGTLRTSNEYRLIEVDVVTVMMTMLMMVAGGDMCIHTTEISHFDLNMVSKGWWFWCQHCRASSLGMDRYDTVVCVCVTSRRWWYRES